MPTPSSSGTMCLIPTSRELQARGFHSEVVALPNSAAPDRAAWERTLRVSLRNVDDRSVLVGHSLGCFALLAHLAGRRTPWSVGHLALVSGFMQPLARYPELDGFVSNPPSLESVRNNVDRITVLASDNDSVVSPSLTASLASALGAKLTVVPGGGHFMDSEGFDELPQLLSAMSLPEDVLEGERGKDLGVERVVDLTTWRLRADE